ncbi:hypothetical protein ABEF93_001778 [Exophiala dermatitidis]
MASTTAINTWMEELALTFIPSNSKSTGKDIRKHKDAFVRRIKDHNYGRTDQFAVAEKLSGLEEKFMVANLDDVAEELYSRRMELSRYNERWIPDVLDLLLHLSHEPVKYSRVENLRKLRPPPQALLPLKWADLNADDPVDAEDDIWKVPDYSDFSSDEDDIVVFSNKKSPASAPELSQKQLALDKILDVREDDVDPNSSHDFKIAQLWRVPQQDVAISEKQAVREVLFMLTGLPTAMFISSERGPRPNPLYRIRHLDHDASRTLLDAASDLGSQVDRVRQWVAVRQTEKVMQVIQDRISDVLVEFERLVSRVQYDILHETSCTGVISFMQILHMMKKRSGRLRAISSITSHLPQNDTVACMNTLYTCIDRAYSACDSVTSDTLLPIFTSAFQVYAQPYDTWLSTGKLTSSTPFYISESQGRRSGATLWHDWFMMSPGGAEKLPCFLQPVADKMFKAGKTAAFLQHLGQPNINHGKELLGIADALTETITMMETSPIPFSATFEILLNQKVDSLLVSSTAALQEILEGHCGLTRLLDALGYLYLGVDGVILDRIESRLFGRIDRCLDMWNDRFLVADLLAEAYQRVECIETDSITVQSTYTFSKSMASRRRSVKILGTVAVSYPVSWPLANIIPPASMGSYQRIALMLSQIRRAKFVLERRAYFNVQHSVIGTGGDDQPIMDMGKRPEENMEADLHVPMKTEVDMRQTDQTRRNAQALYTTLLYFVNVLYDHLTTCTIGPLTSAMRAKLTLVIPDGKDDVTTPLRPASSVDDMIAVHARYVRTLTHACLVSAQIKPLRDSLLAILDLCIRLADLVAVSSASVRKAGPQREREGSFVSARSRHRLKRRHVGRHGSVTQISSNDLSHDMSDSSSFGNADGDSDGEQDVSDAEEENDDEQYSTFMLDEDTSLMQEMTSLRASFIKHASFLVAGLRGAAKTSAEVGDGFELLADSLDGIVTKARGKGSAL